MNVKGMSKEARTLYAVMAAQVASGYLASYAGHEHTSKPDEAADFALRVVERIANKLEI